MSDVINNIIDHISLHLVHMTSSHFTELIVYIAAAYCNPRSMFRYERNESLKMFIIRGKNSLSNGILTYLCHTNQPTHRIFL